MSMMPHQHPSKITRFSPPNSFDQMPEGSFCEVIFESGERVLYIQKSPDTDNPQWVQVGEE